MTLKEAKKLQELLEKLVEELKDEQLRRDVAEGRAVYGERGAGIPAGGIWKRFK